MQIASVLAWSSAPSTGVLTDASFAAKIAQFSVKVAPFSAAVAPTTAQTNDSGAVDVPPFFIAVALLSTEVALFDRNMSRRFATVSIFSGPQWLPPRSTESARSKGSPVRSNWTLIEKVMALFRS